MVGSGSDVCKIGITKNYQERLQDHVRRPYHGFVRYVEFTTGKAIATIFKINNFSLADKCIKELFGSNQFENYEIYNVDYDETIKKLYFGLKDKNVFIELIEDGYSIYDFVVSNSKYELDTTTKKNFELIKKQIIDKYGDNLPEKLLFMLRDINDFKENCKSHYNTGNYICFNSNLVLNLNYNKEKRIEILKKLKKII